MHTSVRVCMYVQRACIRAAVVNGGQIVQSIRVSRINGEGRLICLARLIECKEVMVGYADLVPDDRGRERGLLIGSNGSRIAAVEPSSDPLVARERAAGSGDSGGCGASCPTPSMTWKEVALDFCARKRQRASILKRGGKARCRKSKSACEEGHARQPPFLTTFVRPIRITILHPIERHCLRAGPNHRLVEFAALTNRMIAQIASQDASGSCLPSYDGHAYTMDHAEPGRYQIWSISIRKRIKGSSAKELRSEHDASSLPDSNPQRP